VWSYYQQGGSDDEGINYNKQQIVLPSSRSREASRAVCPSGQEMCLLGVHKQRIFSAWCMRSAHILTREREEPMADIITDVSRHFLGKAH
jgi:hypothetical protein